MCILEFSLGKCVFIRTTLHNTDRLMDAVLLVFVVYLFEELIILLE